MALDVFILGSCVTRDAFEYDLSGNFRIVHYSARSSLATFCFPKIKSPLNIEKLKSNFQKKMLKDDHDRNFFQYLNDKDFDLFILDLIDERGGLINIDDLGYVTNLSELKESGVIDLAKSIAMIEPHGDTHKKYLLEGFDKLYSELINKGKENFLIINKVFWATRIESNENISKNINYILKANKFLEEIYFYISENYPKVFFLNYDNSDFVANSKHKWGLSPFHYVDGLYQETINKIENFYFTKEVEILDLNLSYEENNIFFYSNIESPYEMEFAAYLFKNSEVVDKIWYQNTPLFKFNIKEKGVYKTRIFCRRKGTKFIKSKFSNILCVD
jgi:hypothetical protein